VKISHFFVASLGTCLLHFLMAYLLFIGSATFSQPALKECMLTQVHLIEEPQPRPHQEEIQQELPHKIEPIVEKKSEKKVFRALEKTISAQKSISKPSLEFERTVSHKPLAEEIAGIQASESTVHEYSQPSASEHKDEILLVYLAKVRKKIQGSLRYPSLAKKMGMEGEAIVAFFIHANGMVDASSIKIAKSSGKTVLDRNAIDAVIEALPFDLPPYKDMEIKVPVVFKLTS